MARGEVEKPGSKLETVIYVEFNVHLVYVLHRTDFQQHPRTTDCEMFFCFGHVIM